MNMELLLREIMKVLMLKIIKGDLEKLENLAGGKS